MLVVSPHPPTMLWQPKMSPELAEGPLADRITLGLWHTGLVDGFKPQIRGTAWAFLHTSSRTLSYWVRISWGEFLEAALKEKVVMPLLRPHSEFQVRRLKFLQLSLCKPLLESDWLSDMEAGLWEVLLPSFAKSSFGRLHKSVSPQTTGDTGASPLAVAMYITAPRHLGCQKWWHPGQWRFLREFVESSLTGITGIMVSKPSCGGSQHFYNFGIYLVCQEEQLSLSDVWVRQVVWVGVEERWLWDNG